MNFITRHGRTLLFTAVLVVGSVCVSNGDNPSALVGQWVDMNDGATIELFKDGTGAIDDNSITWKTEGKRFVLSSGNKSKIVDYNLSGYELTMTYDDGYITVLVKKDKVEEYKKRVITETRQKRKEIEQKFEKTSSYFTDSRNGQKYRTVTIGGKTWMAQNLNYQTGKSWCYGDDNSNCEIYGRLYDWNTAKTACPTGWHLPSQKEWNDLVVAAGGNVAGKALKSTYGWVSGGNGADEFGFSALPSGGRELDGTFDIVGEGGVWWTAKEDGVGGAYYRIMNNENRVDEFANDKRGGSSVRCLQDN
jgi:uncharacterized protein (TIGR02145 family)